MHLATGVCTYLLKTLIMHNLLLTIACISQPCSPGSECRVCNATSEAYCVYSCAIDNGGCDEGKQCLQMDVPTCNPDQCCSPVNITCSGMQ